MLRLDLFLCPAGSLALVLGKFPQFVIFDVLGQRYLCFRIQSLECIKLESSSCLLAYGTNGYLLCFRALPQKIFHPFNAQVVVAAAFGQLVFSSRG